MKSAFLLVGIRDNKFQGACIFSERNPTVNAGTLLALVRKEEAPTYEEASARLREYVAIAHPWLELSR